jgi:hypothetical protein
MGSHSNGCWTHVVASAVLLIAEALTLYAYSYLFLVEGQPQWHSDPNLKTLAWLCIIAALLEPVLVIWWLMRKH